MTMIDAGDVRLWAERTGDPADPAVLLIAGAQAQGIFWPDELVRRLVATGLQVIRYDHRDTGESDVVDFDAAPYTMDELTADSLAVLDHFGVRSAHVAGTSLGGFIGQLLAFHHAERVRTLTLIATMPGDDVERDVPPPPAEFGAAMGAAMQLPRDTAEQRVAADVVIFEAMGGKLPFDREAAHDLATRCFARARDHSRAIQHIRAVQASTATVVLNRITAPTLVVAGTDDPLAGRAHAMALHEGIPGSHLELIEGMGHTFFSPGLPERIADLILTQTSGRPGTRN